MKKFISLLLLATLAIGVGWAGNYVKVTSTDNVTAGVYLIVYEDGSLAFDGSLATLDAESNTQSVTITDGTITSNATVNAFAFTIAVKTGGFSIKSASGRYIGQTGNSNGLKDSDTDEFTNAITIDESGNANIVSSSAYLRYNKTSGQTRFRYFKSSSYTNQQAIQLYKLDEASTAPNATVTFNPADGSTVRAGSKVSLALSGTASGIKYTTDNTAPNANSADYSDPITVTGNAGGTFTIRAIAYNTNGSDYAASTAGEQTATYTLAAEDPAAQPGDEVIFKYGTGEEFAQENGEALVTSVKNGITIEFSGGTTPSWYSRDNGNARVYNGNTITITAPSIIESVTFTYDGSYPLNESTEVTPGSWSNATWTVGAASGTLTVKNTSRISTITVKLADASFVFATTITLDPAEGPYVEGTPVTVSLACETQGASIQYALGEGEFQAYNAPFTISATTTISAKAVKGDKESTVTTQTVTFSPAAATIAQALALETGTEFTFTGNAVVTYQNGSNLWIKDASGFGLIYQANLPTYANGDVIPAGWRATRTDHNGTKEFTNVTGLTASTQTGDGSPVVKTANDITTADENAYYQINNVQLSGTTGTITITDESGTVNGYNKFGIDMPQDGVEGKVYNVVGIIGRYNGKAQLNLVSIEDVTPHDFTLTILPATYDGTKPVEVSIVANNAVGDCMITYTTDGTDPYESSTAVTYGDPFTIGQSCTVRAYAFDENDNEATAEKEFTINLAEFAIVPSVPAGNIYGETEVTFTPVNGFGDLTILYTVNGGENQEATGEFTVNITETTTVEIIAEDGYGREFADEFVYTMRDKAAAFKLVTSAEQLQQAVGKQVLIGGYVTGDDNMYVMSTQNNNNRAAVAVSLNGKDGVLDMIARTDAHAVMQLGKEGNNYTFYDIDEQGYLYAASSTSNHLKTKATLDANGKAAITVDADTHEAAIVFQGGHERNTLRFNAGNSNTDPLFSCYSANNSQQPVYLYVEAEPEVEVEFGENNTWATYISDIDLNTPAGLQAYVVESVTGDVANGTEVSYIPAGVGVLLKQVDTAQSDSYTTTVYTGQTSEHNSLLKGGTTVPEGAYLLYNDCFYQAETGELPAHRCYLELPAGTTNAPARVRISIGETTGIDGIQASDVQAVQYVNALGQTSDRPFRGVNIVVTRHNDGTVRTSKAVF